MKGAVTKTCTHADCRQPEVKLPESDALYETKVFIFEHESPTTAKHRDEDDPPADGWMRSEHRHCGCKRVWIVQDAKLPAVQAGP